MRLDLIAARLASAREAFWPSVESPRREAFQSAQLRRLVRFAAREVPYYREHFRSAGLDPETFRGLADLERVPVTTKRDLADRPVSDRVAGSHDPARLQVVTSSGSTGTLFRTFRTRLENRLLGRAALQIDCYDGRAGDRIAVVRVPRPLGTVGVARSPGPTARRRLGRSRPVRFSTLLPADELARQLSRFDPHIIQGFPGAILRAAASAREQGIRIAPRLVVTAGEATAARDRAMLESLLGAPVLDRYYASEFQLGAGQMRVGCDLHVMSSLIVEVVRPGGSIAPPGEEGAVLITNLFAFASPLIRYPTGDVARRGSGRCPCGFAGPTLKGLVGRQVDMFTLPGGREVHPWHFVNVMLEDGAWIRQYQLRQETETRVILDVEMRHPLDDGAEERLRRSFRDAFGDGLSLDIVSVSEIRPEPSGKYRVVRSLVTDPPTEDDRAAAAQ
jgi:phenylacetate-CoA ligase